MLFLTGEEEAIRNEKAQNWRDKEEDGETK